MRHFNLSGPNVTGLLFLFYYQLVCLFCFFLGGLFCFLVGGKIMSSVVSLCSPKISSF